MREHRVSTYFATWNLDPLFTPQVYAAGLRAYYVVKFCDPRCLDVDTDLGLLSVPVFKSPAREIGHEIENFPPDFLVNRALPRIALIGFS